VRWSALFGRSPISPSPRSRADHTRVGHTRPCRQRHDHHVERAAVTDHWRRLAGRGNIFQSGVALIGGGRVAPRVDRIAAS
jgi:hypothetical protein